MTTTKMIELLKKYEYGGATDRPREVMFCVGDDIYNTDFTDISTGDGLLTELFLSADAQPERKTGRWERHYSRPNVYADLWWHCSVCGYKNDDQYANRYYHYCPNCGAKMEGEHEID